MIANFFYQNYRGGDHLLKKFQKAGGFRGSEVEGAGIQGKKEWKDLNFRWLTIS